MLSYQPRTSFKCYLIGETKLLIHCAEALQKHGHVVLGLISKSDDVKVWASKYKLPCTESPQFLLKIKHSYDFLFSIVNPKVLSNSLLTTAKQAAINYHDSLLPQYAGVHATAWAIINGETEHGVTWHKMTTGIDEGELLKQRRVLIKSTDSSFSLNIKCLEQAIISFETLVAEITHNESRLMPQVLSERSYYHRHQKPDGVGVIDWHNTAESIERTHRALTMGQQIANKLATTKVTIGSCFFVPTHIHLMNANTESAPGTLVAIDAHGFTVATATGTVKLKGLLTPEGKLCDPNTLAHRFQLRIGDSLPLISEVVRHTLTEIATRSSQDEAFWVRRLKAIEEPSSLPCLKKSQSELSKMHAHLTTLQFPSSLLKSSTYTNPCQLMLANLVAYLYRVNGHSNVTVGWGHSSFDALPVDIQPYWQQTTPLTLKFTTDTTISDCVDQLLQGSIVFDKRDTHLRDLSIRYPTLKNKVFQPSLTIQYKREAQSLPPSQVVMVIAPDTGCLTVFVDKDLSDALKNQIRQSLSHIEVLLRESILNPTAPIVALPFITPAESKFSSMKDQVQSIQ